jgi:hypothetical protein
MTRAAASQLSLSGLARKFVGGSCPSGRVAQVEAASGIEGVFVGGVSTRPRVVDGQIVVRGVLDLTVTIDHNAVDGAPAARFGAELRELLESATVLRDLQ